VSASTGRKSFAKGGDLTATVWKLAAFSLMMSDCPMPTDGDKSLHRYPPMRGLQGDYTMLLQLVDIDNVVLFLPWWVSHAALRLHTANATAETHFGVVAAGDRSRHCGGPVVGAGERE